jgi:SNF2 family DNA or RNA helicase
MPVSYFAIQERLGEIEEDLGTRQNEYEQAAEDFHKLTKDFELRMARAGLTAKGDTATEKKWRALDSIAAAEDTLYSDLKEAEGKYKGLQAAVKVLETRATIGMSLLKSFEKEAGRAGRAQQPAWSNGAGE